MTRPDYARYTRWYPSSWRERYGVEFVTLLEETYAGERVPVKARLSIVRAGTFERAREFGLAGVGGGDQRAITGSALAILMAWAAFVVAGSVFAKYVEHWQWVTSAHDQRLPTVAYDVVAAGAMLGALITGVAAFVAVPAFLRHLRSQGWRGVRAPLRRVALAGLIMVASTVALLLWARSLHGGGAAPFWPNRLVFLTWFGVVAAMVFLAAASVGGVVRRVEFPTRVTRTFGGLALAMNVVLVAIFAGVVTWWGAIATYAPWFFVTNVLTAPATTSPRAFTIVGSLSHVAPAPLIVVGLVMVPSLLVALYGSARIAVRLRRAD